MSQNNFYSTKFIALTGNISVGKSTVSSLLKENGCHVICADDINHKMLSSDREIIRQIKEEFGDKYINENGVDRKSLGELVFSDHEKLRKLASITQSKLSELINKELTSYSYFSDGKFVIYDSPLLFESGEYKRFYTKVLVHAPENVQLERLMKRNSLTKESALARINSQISQDEKLESGVFDFVVYNNANMPIRKTKNTISLEDKVDNLITSIKQRYRYLEGY